MGAPDIPDDGLLLLASDGYQSLLTLRRLLAHGVTPRAIALAGGLVAPATPQLGGIRLTTAAADNSLAAIAGSHGIPLLDGRPDSLQEACGYHPPALILSSCYPYRLPNTLLALPCYGCFNLHPSLLPAYRGPSPIFWQLRDGISHSGVSVHRMRTCLDAGELLCQRHLRIPDGCDYFGWVKRLTHAGVDAFIDRLPAWLSGDVTLTAQPAGGSYHGWPEARDFVVDPSWTPQHIYNFIHGSRALGHALLRTNGSEIVELDTILGYDASARPSDASPPGLRQQAQRVTIQGDPGRLVISSRPIPANVAGTLYESNQH